MALVTDSLQSADKLTNKKAVLWQGSRRHDAIVKFDTYRNLQRHPCDSTTFFFFYFCLLV